MHIKLLLLFLLLSGCCFFKPRYIIVREERSVPVTQKELQQAYNLSNQEEKYSVEILNAYKEMAIEPTLDITEEYLTPTLTTEEATDSEKEEETNEEKNKQEETVLQQPVNATNTKSDCPYILVLQHPVQRDLVRCRLCDTVCILNYEKRGYEQLRYVPQFAGVKDVPSDSDYPTKKWRNNNSIPRW